jgi:hypothetical protein
MTKELRSAALRMLTRANALGLTTKSGTDVVVDLMEELLAASQGYRNVHAYRAALAKQAPEDTSGQLDVMVPAGRDCWVTMGAFTVHPNLTDEGIVVDVFATGAITESIASTYAMHEDAEVALGEAAGIDPDEADDWMEARTKYPGQVVPAERWELLQQFIALRQAAPATPEPARLIRDVLDSLGYEFTRETADSKWTWVAPTDEAEERFDDEAAAVAHAWRDACSQAMAVHAMAQTDWDALPFAEQQRLMLALQD